MLSALARDHERLDTRRHEQARRMASLYEQLELVGITGDCYGNAGEYLFEGTPIANNRAQAICDTLQAKIASLDEPRPQFIVTDGTYEQKRQAVWLDRFVEGLYYQQQGMFRDTWALWRHAFLVATAATGSVAVKIFAVEGENRICSEIHNTLDMWVDQAELRYGYPLTFGEQTLWDAERLCDEYPAQADHIWATAEREQRPTNGAGEARSSDRQTVKVDEGWRIKVRRDEPGRYCMAVAGEPLEWEPYDFEEPPFVFFHYRRRLAGFWGASLTETVFRSVVRENQIIDRLDESENKNPVTVMYYDPNIITRSKLTVPKDVILLPYDSKAGPPPQAFAQPWFHPNALQLIDLHARSTFEASGVNEMAVTSRVQGGAKSGVALRTELSLLNERFAPKQRDIVNAIAVDTARHYARAARQLSDKNPDFHSEWPGGKAGLFKKIPAKDVFKLPDDIWTVRPAPVSEQKNSPEDRLEEAWEMVNQGVITMDQYQGMKEHQDTVGAKKRSTVLDKWVDAQVGKWLYAPRADFKKRGFYVSPIKMVNLDAALDQVVDAYLQAQLDEVPEERRRFFLRFMSDLGKKQDQKAANQNGGNQPPPAAGAMPPPPPGDMSAELPAPPMGEPAAPLASGM